MSARPRHINWILGLALIVLGSATAMASETPAPPAKPTTKTASCVSDGCHSSVLDHKFMHGPVAQQKCEACHVYDEPRDHRFKPAGSAELCVTCHPMDHRTVVHEPVKNGDCTGCHNPHGSEFRMMLVADPTRGLCLTCHKRDTTEEKFVHGPVAAGACILCHQPHSSWNANLLVKSVNDLCGGCHSEVEQAGEGVHVHAALKEGCTNCHDPHASKNRFILHAPAPELCGNCHAQTLHAISEAKVVHGAVEAAGGCTQCHSPHSSPLPNLQRQTEPQVCLSCHDKAITTAQGRTLTNMAELLEEHPDHHGPIREGACTSCHQPHAGEQANLLAKTYPPEFYAPFAIDRYDLCFTCHISDMVTAKSGTGLTRFRDGATNLHWLHVNQTKGRTCRACHEVHASKRPFHIRESVPFGTGGWMLEVNFEVTPDGGSCAPGCHEAKTYHRGDADEAAAPELHVKGDL